MLNKDITLSSPIILDEYVQYVYDKLDVQPSDTLTVHIPFPDDTYVSNGDWNIGMVCGFSGSGKSTILNRLGRRCDLNIDTEKTVISCFKDANISPQQASEILFNVGLCSIPSWLNRVKNLSNGERARFDVAIQIASVINSKQTRPIIIDEWTSLVNRDVANSMSHSIQKYIRKLGLKVIFASCHYDVIEWLQCDWIFNLNKKPSHVEKLVYLDEVSNYNCFGDIAKEVVLSKEVKI